jgi:putative PIN family toxin of toxin-antitoxin system
VLRVVLDANVFVSALIRPEGPPGRVVQALSVQPPPFELVLSEALADEIHAALGYSKVRKSLRDKTVDPNDWFSNYELLADFAEPTAVTGIAPDPDDDKVIAAAVGGRADFIVTGDKALAGVGAFEAVRIVTPATFLDAILKIGAPR